MIGIVSLERLSNDKPRILPEVYKPQRRQVLVYLGHNQADVGELVDEGGEGEFGGGNIWKLR